MEADRILMVCTEKYVQKAEAGQEVSVTRR